MNRERRKQIENEVDKIRDIIINLEMVRDDEEYAHDSMPENLQYSQRGEESEMYIDMLDDVISKLEEAVEAYEEV